MQFDRPSLTSLLIYVCSYLNYFGSTAEKHFGLQSSDLLRTGIGTIWNPSWYSDMVASCFKDISQCFFPQFFLHIYLKIRKCKEIKWRKIKISKYPLVTLLFCPTFKYIDIGIKIYGHRTKKNFFSLVKIQRNIPILLRK